MTAQAFFKIANTVSLLAWLLLIVLGRKRMIPELVTGIIVPILLAALYVALLFTHLGGAHGDFNSLDGVAALFSNPWLLLAGWVHYLAFDLFIGSWEVRDAVRHGISHFLVIPCLVLTFLFGPAGLLVYLCLRFALRRSIAVGSAG